MSSSPFKQKARSTKRKLLLHFVLLQHDNDRALKRSLSAELQRHHTPAATTYIPSLRNSRADMACLLVLLCIVALLQVANAFTASRSFIRGTKMSLTMAQKEAFQLVLLRHGESSWNKENKFTGW